MKHISLTVKNKVILSDVLVAFWLLFFVLFLGCGQTNDKNIIEKVETSEETSEYGKVTLRVIKDSKRDKIPANATNLTVRIFDSSRNLVQDFALSDTIQTTFSLPVGDNYILDGISSEKTTYKRLILTVGRSDLFAVLPNQTTTVNLTLSDYMIDWTGTDTDIKEGSNFAIRVTITGADLLSDRAYLDTGWTAWTMDGKPPYSRPIKRTQLTVSQTTVNGNAVYSITGDITAPIISNKLPLVSPKIMYYQIYIYAKYDYRVDSIPLLYLPSLSSGENLRELNISADAGELIIQID